jgi:hypothetical protein
LDEADEAVELVGPFIGCDMLTRTELEDEVEKEDSRADDGYKSRSALPSFAKERAA